MKRLVFFLSLFMVVGIGQAAFAQEYGLGDIPLDPETYKRHLRSYPDQLSDGLPTAYDARNDGIVTPAKNQGSCGSCWAFASAGAMESHILKNGGPAYDLSEQQQVSCNTSFDSDSPPGGGCCGGSSSAPQYWQTTGPIYESCGPYGESGTSCPTKRTATCASMSACEQLSYRVTNWHTVGTTPTDFKTSLYTYGPSYWRFTVYSDFQTYWSSAASGLVYTNTGGTKQGGHAVLLIGWDDAKGAYLCKNSWGPTGGPNRDGTFWIAYSGHTNNLGFGMSNFELDGGWSICLQDPSFGDQLWLDIDPATGLIVNGQVFYGGALIGAITGCIANGPAFSIQYLGDLGLRYYLLYGGTQWYTWGINSLNSSYYDGPRAAQLVPCGTTTAGTSPSATGARK
jgi:hypothetical protein